MENCSGPAPSPCGILTLLAEQNLSATGVERGTVPPTLQADWRRFDNTHDPHELMGDSAVVVVAPSGDLVGVRRASLWSHHPIPG